MLATDTTDLGILILCIGISVAIVMVARFARFLRASVGSMNVEVGQINKAVNQVGPDEPTLIEQVRQIGAAHTDHVRTMEEYMDIRDNDYSRLRHRFDDISTALENQGHVMAATRAAAEAAVRVAEVAVTSAAAATAAVAAAIESQNKVRLAERMSDGLSEVVT